MVRRSCKPPPSLEAPWGTHDGLSAAKSCAALSYVAIAPSAENRAQPIIPKAQMVYPRGPGDEAKFVARSTMQDAYQTLSEYKPMPSYKPKLVFVSTPALQPYSTTSRAAYLPHNNSEAKRAPFIPARREVDGSKFETTSTAQDSYQRFVGPGYRPRQPILPQQRVSTPTTFDHTSTSRASYTRLTPVPYKKASKPKEAMGTDGIMA